MLEAVHAPQPLPYVRLGSRHATAEQYRSKLLGSLLAHVNNRSEILEIVSKPRIFVGTLSSFTQQEELLKMKTFERLVLDEASQIIEPQLVGILTKFRHVVLVGDHRQLPAVTAQPEASCAVTDADLNDIGLTDLRNSYFERMYQRCKANKQFHHFDQLRHQGRMHQDIMEFPGHYFYDDQLEILPNRPEQQTEALFYDLTGKFPHFDRSLGENRVVFLESPEEDYLPGQKTSLGEATLLVQLVHFFKDLYAANDLVWLPHKTLGIITPWRAQIAQIRQSLMLAGFSADDFSIDTVERYQGSARDIILVSTCVHHAAQMSSLTSLSAENIDRKLNVALTRARHHLIVVGKSSVLNQSAHYREFIRLYKITR
jgi:DNA replication ATP-dependent helicase Dna2